MITHRFPFPPTRGDTIRAWGELEHLARRHDVWLACVDRAAPAAEHLRIVRALCRDVKIVLRPRLGCLLSGGLSLLSGGSLTEGYFGNVRLRRTLQEWSDSIGFDAVLTFSSAMAPYARLVSAQRRVLDMNDVDSLKWRSFAERSASPLGWLYSLEAKRLAELEARAAHEYDVCLLVNERERRKLVDLVDAKCTEVVRTGVDLSRYQVLGPDHQSSPIVGMIGSMSYPPNVRSVNWFGRCVWPIIKRSEPRAEWLIVGSRPTRSVRRWAKLPGVTVTGFVEDVRPHLRSMCVVANAVAEEIGVQTKLIETLAIGKPAVVTPAAAEGIDYAAGGVELVSGGVVSGGVVSGSRVLPPLTPHPSPLTPLEAEPPFLIAETPEEFAASVLRLFCDRELASRLSRRSRMVAETNYRVQEQVELIERCLQPPPLDWPEASQQDEHVSRRRPSRVEAVV